MSDMSPTRTRVQRLMDERVTVDKLHEDLISHVEQREDKTLTEVEQKQATAYRERQAEIDMEIEGLKDVLEREQRSTETSKLVRAHLTGSAPGVDTENGQTKYRTFGAYARDQLIVMKPEIANIAGGREVLEAAKERIQRLQRTPENTTSSDVAGLIPNDYLTQILDVIDASRPVVSSARRVGLNRGKLSYPRITQRPNVLLQASEKTEGGTQNMTVEMVDMTAQTFIGAGDLSWQAMEWSTPDALDLWFSLQAEAYAQKTEGTACAVLTAAAGTIATTISGGTADTYDKWLAAVLAGANAVYTNTRAMADTIWMSPDMFFAAAALTSTANAQLITAGNLNLGSLGGSLAGLRVVVSAGFGTSIAIVGDSSAFIVAETPGAPVQLRAVEPAIGGLEVGVIGAFAAAAFADARFSQIGAP